MAGCGRPSQYLPRTGSFAALSGDAVRLTLPEMEAIIGAPLPPRARAPAFWSNRSPRLFGAQPWVQAGWRVVRTELHSAPPAVHLARVVRVAPTNQVAERAL